MTPCNRFHSFLVSWIEEIDAVHLNTFSPGLEDQAARCGEVQLAHEAAMQPFALYDA